MIFKQSSVLLTLAAALLAPQTVAFSPGCSVKKRDASTRLMYRNYDDISMTNLMTNASEAADSSSSSSPTATAAEEKIKKIIIKKKQGSKSVTPPKLLLEDTATTSTTLDVDADRMPLSILLEPPAAPLTIQEDQQEKQQQSTNTPPSRTSSFRVTSTASRAADTRSSPIVQLFNIEDYNQHVLNSPPNQLCIIRFSAPWCQVCRTTNVSWERMAAKISKMNSGRRNVKFLSVHLDGKSEEVVELKDMLRIEGVPQGIIHHTSDGLVGQRVNLNRKNLGNLKKELESYLTNDMGADMFLYRLKKEL